MKLKCGHGRRVMVVGALHSVIHRNDGSRCSDNHPRIGNSVLETREPRLVWYDGKNNLRREA